MGYRPPKPPTVPAHSAFAITGPARELEATLRALGMDPREINERLIALGGEFPEAVEIHRFRGRGARVQPGRTTPMTK